MSTGFIEWELGQTAYSIIGDLDSAKVPLVTLHGGPGFLGKGMTTVARYAESAGRPAVTYDQLGCGKSTAHKEKSPDFWQIEIFVQEFNELINQLGIAENFALIGHSWGGLLAAEIAITQPNGLKALILSSPLGDTDTWVADVKKLLAEMPPEISSVIIESEEAGTTDTEEYMAAAFKFYDKHVIRVPMPPDVAEMFDEALADQNVYNAMWGPSELMCNGTLAGHVVTDRLQRIEVPTLIMSGKYDECTATTAGAYHSGIKGSRWELFEESSHLSYVEEAAKYQRVMNEFLDSKC